MKRSAAQNLSPNQRTTIRHSDETDLALARKYGVSTKTIEAVRLAAVPQRFVLGHNQTMATKKDAPKKRATKAKKAAPRARATRTGLINVEPAAEPDRLEPSVLGGPDLPRPLR